LLVSCREDRVLRGTGVELRAAAVPADGTWLGLAGLYDLKRNGISRRSRIHAEQSQQPQQPRQPQQPQQEDQQEGFFNNPRGFGFSA